MRFVIFGSQILSKNKIAHKIVRTIFKYQIEILRPSQLYSNITQYDLIPISSEP